MGLCRGVLRVGVDLVKETTTVVLIKDTCEAPWLFLEWLYVLNLNNQDVPGLCTFHLKRTREVMNSGEVDVLHIIRAVIVANLSSCPVYALHLEDFPIFNFGRKRNCRRGQLQLGRIVEGSSCRLGAIYSMEGQRMFDSSSGSSTNMKHGLLISWLLQIDLDGGTYFRETHAAGESDKRWYFSQFARWD